MDRRAKTAAFLAWRVWVLWSHMNEAQLWLEAQATPPPDASWLHILVQGFLLKVNTSVQVYSQYLFAKIHSCLWQSKWFAVHQSRALLQRKPESPPVHETWGAFCWKAQKLVLCIWAGTKRMGESQILLGTACQTHSSGKRSYDQWPSGLLWPMQIHSWSIFRLSKQDPARLGDLWGYPAPS